MMQWLTSLVNVEDEQFQTNPRRVESYGAAIQEDVDILERHTTRLALRPDLGVVQPKYRSHVLLDVSASTSDDMTEADLRYVLMTVPLLAQIYQLGLREGRMIEREKDER